jgi:hypothetical protein
MAAWLALTLDRQKNKKKKKCFLGSGLEIPDTVDSVGNIVLTV